MRPTAACQIGQFRWELWASKLREILWAVKPSAQDEQHLWIGGLAKSTEIDKRLDMPESLS